MALFSLNGAGILLAYSESGLAAGEHCSRPCCDLGKMGAEFASSCCQLRCHEDVPENGSEPAREQIHLKKTVTQSAVLESSSSLLPAAEISRPSLERNFLRPADDHVALHVKLSVFLV
jgi:hypothetical protein